MSAEIQTRGMGWLWMYFKSIIPWHTSHQVALDAKGVPKDIRVSVKGLPNHHHISVGLDVDEKGKNALITFIYAVSFLIMSFSIFLLAGTLVTLVPVIASILQVLLKPIETLQDLPFTIMAAIVSLTSWIGAWNSGMITYIVLYTKYHFNETGCKCYGFTIGSENKLWVPVCFIICKLFDYILMGEMAYYFVNSAYSSLLRQF